jgi:lipopolysaccharide transport system permease protein
MKASSPAVRSSERPSSASAGDSVFVKHRLGAHATTRPTVHIVPRRGWFDLDLRSIFAYRELLYFLVWRDVKVRYKQAAIGVAWVVLQPLLTMLLFAVIFGRFAGIPSDNVPYPLFAFTALLPWTYFQQAISRSGTSLVSNSTLISKVYFPRLLIPLSGVLSPLIDFMISFVVLLGMMAWYRVTPTTGVLALPIFLLLAVMTAVAVSLYLSALNVQYRDVEHTIPFLVQFWMYASPVVYSIKIVPQKWRLLYSLNPMAGTIEGFRWALLGNEHPDFVVMAMSAATVVVLLIAGLVFFRRMERTFADVI